MASANGEAIIYHYGTMMVREVRSALPHAKAARMNALPRYLKKPGYKRADAFGNGLVYGSIFLLVVTSLSGAMILIFGV